MEIASRLRLAREYEKKIAGNNLAFQKFEFEKDNGRRPYFHMTPLVGWTNDPNGFSYYDGRYHLFYQYNPYECKWGPMHWGHVVTDDFIHWQYKPTAMAPDKDYDSFGCFSGTAVTDGEEHILMYTSVREIDDCNGGKLIRQEQSIAVGNGENYKKLESNPIITAECLPNDFSKEDFRDPKIWKIDQYFYAIIANRHSDESGQLLLFRAENLNKWEYLGVLAHEGGKYGKMWECPDIFRLEDKDVIIFSPQDMEENPPYWHAGNCTMYWIGNLDYQNVSYNIDSVYPIDYGTDFYAPQTCKTPDGRIVMIAWMKSWDMPVEIANQTWSGMMCLPRELSLQNGRLIQSPVRELDSIENKIYCKKGISINTENKKLLSELSDINSRCLDIKMKIYRSDYKQLTLSLAENENYRTTITHSVSEGKIILDRSRSGLRRDFVMRREMPLQANVDVLDLRIILDRHSVEIFAEGGLGVMTCLIPTPDEAKGISIYSDGEAVFDLEIYQICP